ncbi:MAG: UDP-N-acetyl-2-amino-2-deoxyglucuronate dehydrogenase [Clostridiales bacterium]|jgi:predicted dehydrogenase|nr:UDP-N-acetyl-2-amino-2-deoxyglucuronate dehydrogenase [Clostridiales bacterium]
MRFAIVGCGVISATHSACIDGIDGAELVAVADIVEEKAQKLAQKYGCDYYVDYHDMLKRDDIDVINVCVPSGLHHVIAIDAMKAGKHVIVEKPMDVTLPAADAMLETAYKTGMKMSIISQHRFDDAMIEIKKAIDSGRLGKLYFGASHTKWYRSQEYYDSGDWRGTWELDGGGAIMNQSVHYVDLLQYALGPVDEIYAYTGTLAHVRIEVEDLAVASVKFKSGALGMIEGSTLAWPGLSTKLDIYGENGTVGIENDKLAYWNLKDATEEDKHKLSSKQEIKVGAADAAAISASSHARQIMDMMDSIKNNRDPKVNGEEGRKPLAVIVALYESARTGKPVKVS